MTTQQHTPTPWVRPVGTDYLIGGNGHNGPIYIATIESATAPNRHHYTAPKERAEANAAFIVRACNAHEALVAVAEQAEAWADELGDDSGGAIAFRNKIRDALKLARGES